MSESTKLRFHKNRRSVWARLPFVDRQEAKSGYCSWAIPRHGGYLGGCEAGKALAMIYLKHLRENGRGLAVTCNTLFLICATLAFLLAN
jgi:hypothetical protein